MICCDRDFGIGCRYNIAMLLVGCSYCPCYYSCSTGITGMTVSANRIQTGQDVGGGGQVLIRGSKASNLQL